MTLTRDINGELGDVEPEEPHYISDDEDEREDEETVMATKPLSPSTAYGQTNVEYTETNGLDLKYLSELPGYENGSCWSI